MGVTISRKNKLPDLLNTKLFRAKINYLTYLIPKDLNPKLN
jgi:hypothetical protein